MAGSKESPERRTEVAQSRLTQVFKFLKALNELRNPVPRDLSAYSQIFWIDRWPTHPTIIVQRGDREDNEDEADVDVEMEPTIRVQRARLTACPNPPIRSLTIGSSQRGNPSMLKLKCSSLETS